jgi:RNA polymerase sigma factor (sigma-70 family)
MAVLCLGGIQTEMRPNSSKRTSQDCDGTPACCCAATETLPTISFRTASNGRSPAGTNAGTMGDLRAWIYTILYHRFLTDRRRQRRELGRSYSTEILGAEQPGIDGGQERALGQRDLLRGFAELPEEQRSVLLLVGVEDFSYQETARILELPIGTVMSRLSRGRERLRQYMNGEQVRVRSALGTALPASSTVAT